MRAQFKFEYFNDDAVHQNYSFTYSISIALFQIWVMSRI